MLTFGHLLPWLLSPIQLPAIKPSLYHLPAMANPLKVEWRKDQLPAELVELRQQLDRLPLPIREKLVPLCERAGHFTRLQSKLVRIAQDAVDQLHLDTKYLLFDLEATRRERDELRRLLDEWEKEHEGSE